MINSGQRDALLAAATRAFNTESPADEAAFEKLLNFFTEGCDAKTIERRSKYAPRILAALVSEGFMNDGARVARAVSLSDMLARAITTQPVAP